MKGEEAKLHEMDPVGRFTVRAADYVKYRPDYPADAVASILEGLGGAGSLTAADIGAGTGILSRMLADRGVHVIAVEPNAAMSREAAPHNLVQWREGTAESTGLQSGSIDLVTSAQAFHWFRQREAVAEFHRILRPGARLAVLWNTRDERDAFTRAYIEVIHAVNGEHPAEQREIEQGVVEADGLFSPPLLRTFEHRQVLDREGLIGRATSASYVPREGKAFEILRDQLSKLFERHKDSRGNVRLLYVTKVYLATRRG